MVTYLPLRAVGVRSPDRVLRAALHLVLRWWPPIVIALTVLVTVYYTLRQDRDFWYDEAMLVEAIRADPWLWPWQPMSQFEQASPYGVYVVQKLSLQLLGFAPDLLRLPGLVAYAFAGFATWRAARIPLGRTSAALAGVFTLCSLAAVQSSGDFKHYVYEYAIAAALMWLGARAARPGSGSGAVIALGVCGIAAIPFSNTVVLVFPGIAAALLLAGRPSRRRMSAVALVGGGFALAFALWYLVAIRLSTAFQVAYPTYKQTSTVDLYFALVQEVAQPSAAFAYSLAGLAALGLVVALVWVRSALPAFVPALTSIVLGFIGVRSGLIPFSADRHLLFLVPLVSFAAAAALHVLRLVLVRAVSPAPRQGAATAAIGIVLALAAVATIQPNATVQRQQAGQALSEYSDRCGSFYVDWWTQPATTLYASALGLSGRVEGQVSAASGLGQQAWAYRVMNHPDAYQRGLVHQVRAHPSTCVLTGGRDDEQALVFAPLAAAGLDCSQIGVVAGVQITTCERRKDA